MNSTPLNPILSRDFHIPFNDITAEHVEPGFRAALEAAQNELDALTQDETPPTFETTLGALDALVERLNRVAGIAYHLMSVRNSPEMRTAFNAVLPAYSGFMAKLSLNDALWQRIKAYAETSEAETLTGVRKRHLEKTLREFVRAGADLPPEQKQRFEAVKVELSQLHTQFSENVLDATNAFEMVLTDEADLTGLPDSARAQAKVNAEAKGLEGYRFTLQAPSYLPFMKHSERRELREHLYQAYVNRASEGELNNRPLIDKILTLRRELADLLGYANFADYVLEENMVGSSAAALEFEEDLYEATLPHWQREVEALKDFANKLGIENLQAHDLAFVSERLRKEQFELDEEELRPYFPLNRVLAGLYEIAERTFGVTITEAPNEQVWHPDVEFYEVRDEAGTHLGSFYADWFPREDKRAGAWKAGFIVGGPQGDMFEPHLAVIAANFSPPQQGEPALLTHREVQTIFHEFGHLLHHVLSQVEVASRGGTNVPRDWVELPSQIMENWTYERDALDLFARHFETGEPLPEELYQKMMAARTFMEANAQMRQLSFGTVDLKLHESYMPEQDGDVIAYGNAQMERFVVKPEFAHNNFLNAFGHVFSGGYAAGYYSYKWSEVLDADAFTRFKDEGIFNRKTGRDFVNSVLSRGDSDDPAELFRAFMGRDPEVGALIERNLGQSVSQSEAQPQATGD